MKIFFRKLHRWLGLLMALQIAAWMLSGFYFSLFPITEIRGEHLTRPPETLDREAVADALPPANALAAVERHLGQDWALASMRLQAIAGKAWWRVEGETGGTTFVRLVDPATGRVRQALSADAAEARAQALLLEPGQNPVVEWLEEEPANQEFRGRDLPVWRVSFSRPEKLNLYLDPWSGDVLARRTDRWRLFDFFWMLHIMDFDAREDFNTPLLQVAAFLGLLVALGGFVLWALTTRLWRRRL